jgi:ankyrin repeat protein
MAKSKQSLNMLLNAAVSCNNVKKAKQLIKQGADVRYNNDWLLCIAVDAGFFEMVKLLVENGARWDILNNNDETAWQMAEYMGRVDIFNFFNDERLRQERLEKLKLLDKTV